MHILENSKDLLDNFISRSFWGVAIYA
jgi:hypothetical protein